MQPSAQVLVEVNLARVRTNAQAIAASTGVPLIAVVKADAYGLGAAAVAEAIGDLVDSFYLFDAAEALAADVAGRTGRPSIVLLADWRDAADYLAHKIRPVVWSVDQGAALRGAGPVLSVDTGQQRFACPAENVAAVMAASDIQEAMTHAVRVEQAERFAAIVEQAMASMSRRGGGRIRRHAAGSALLDDPRCRFDAVRPGMALYRGAVRVTTPLIQATDSTGPAGYGGFLARRFGVIRCGYSNGLRTGPCLVNGQPSQVLEVGMQTAFVEIGPADTTGDLVTLLGDSLTAEGVAAAWRTSAQEVLVRLCGAGVRRYKD